MEVKHHQKIEKMMILNKIHHAIMKLITYDAHLLIVDANERSITHRLGMYLQEEFSEWHVDCEYNKNGLDIKKLDNFKKSIDSNDDKGTTVYPDLIIHQRGTKNNLIVLEAKKENIMCKQIKECPCDMCKLRAYKKDLHYKYAFFLVLPIGKAVKEILYNYQDSIIKEIF